MRGRTGAAGTHWTPRILQGEGQGWEKRSRLCGVTAGQTDLREGVKGHRCFPTYCRVPGYCDGGDGRTSSAAPNSAWHLNTRGQTQGSVGGTSFPSGYSHPRLLFASFPISAIGFYHLVSF